MKESGYASFNLPIDIYLRAGPRDEPKKYSITYDLDIYKTTIKKHQLNISNPSTEFRNKLIDGGGITISNDSKLFEQEIIIVKWMNRNADDSVENRFLPENLLRICSKSKQNNNIYFQIIQEQLQCLIIKSHFAGHLDERTYSQPDSTTTKSRPPSSSGSGGGNKKHKNKSDDIKPTISFGNLFGSPILNSKNSPDPKLSNNSSSSTSSSKLPMTSTGGKVPLQKSSKDRVSEKSGKEKREKKDKSGSTPKEGSKELSVKKLDDKTERREEKRKEKSTTKDRERSKEKS